MIAKLNCCNIEVETTPPVTTCPSCGNNYSHLPRGADGKIKLNVPPQGWTPSPNTPKIDGVIF